MEGIISVLNWFKGIKRKNYINGGVFTLKLAEKKSLLLVGN
jgi:hypothetical protein